MMFTSLSVHYCVRNIRRIFRAKFNKEDNKLSTLMKQSLMMSIYININLQVIVIKIFICNFNCYELFFSRLQPYFDNIFIII